MSAWQTVKTAKFHDPAHRKPLSARLQTDGASWRVDLFVFVNGEKVRKRIPVPLNRVESFRADFAGMLKALEGSRPAKVWTLRALCDWYVDVCMVARGNEQSSRETNRRILGGFCDWMAEQGVTTPAEFTPDLVQRLMAHLADRYGPYTINTRMFTFRAVFRAAVADGLIDRVPGPPTWPKMKVPQRIPKALTPEEVARVLEVAEAEKHKARGPLVFMAHCGCRPSDVCGLKWADIDDDCRIARFIQQKTRASVEVNIVGPARQAVLEARLARQGPFVFPRTEKGVPWRPEAFKSAVRSISLRALGRVATPKEFRAAVVTMLLEHGADQSDVQLITGHRSVAIEAYHARSAGRTLALAEVISAAIRDKKMTQ